ncbi:ferredoxin [Cytobacillus eiseniae]|uniref:Ferredoxin n=1 Tax=Cytobacillus eiseniae TaxID=762947 RepID=A0ABS4RCP5_9BACI|nr:4Fe-4S dicluster domain-containing protein [Cytobacillus eiseniae]MBP2240673.1 ferredoxin [Cytobacillus eiseniae]
MGLLDKWIESLDYEFRILDSCSRYQSPHSTCRNCIDSCSADAITFVSGKPIINNKECTECGDCIAECPVQAVEGFLPRRTIIQNQLIVTDEHPPSIKELLAFYKKGVTILVYDQEELNLHWKHILSEVNSMLEQLNEAPFSILNKEIEREEELFTRREIFSFWKKEAQSTMKQMAPAKWRFNHQDLDLAKFYPNYQFTEIMLDTSKCTICKACQILCKRDCLQINEMDFTITTQNCSGCMICQDICPEKAITTEKKIQPATKNTHPLYTKICYTCKNNYQTLSMHDKKCVKCKKMEAFGTFLK